jgi:hypothetical protein
MGFEMRSKKFAQKTKKFGISTMENLSTEKSSRPLKNSSPQRREKEHKPQGVICLPSYPSASVAGVTSF